MVSLIRFILFLLCFVEYCVGQSFEQDCFVHMISSPYNYKPIPFNSFTIGYLRLSKDNDFFRSQIIVNLLSNRRNQSSSRILEVYFNNRSVSLRENNNLVAASNELVQLPTVYPYWDTFYIRLQNTEFQVFRSYSFIPIVQGIIENTRNVEQLNITITNANRNTPPLYVVLNCMSGCRMFGDLKYPLEMNLSTSFKIHMAFPSGSTPSRTINTRGHFELRVSSLFDYENITINRTIQRGKGGHIEFNVTNDNAGNPGDKRLLLTSAGRVFLNTTRNSTTFSFIVFRSENLWWSFNCKMPFSEDARENRSVEEAHIEKSLKANLTIGEVSAWIIASLSLCGLLVVALTLYSRVTHGEAENGASDEIRFGVSASHIGATGMLPYNPIKSTFYVQNRRPDEGAEPEGLRISTITPDFFYPMNMESFQHEESLPSVDSRDKTPSRFSTEGKV